MDQKNENREVAIQLTGVKKLYKLGQIGGGTLQADMQSWWARVRGKEDPNTKIGQEQRLVGQTFMALNGIDLTIYKGEALGIIGANGAGKSTLLKLLCRVTAPTDGEIDLYGRVSSMLEVKTGFNGEMTGRENIYMRGAILGMTKAEIDSKMERIIDFSEVREFIDTPVKRYSSGMSVKLGFSVSAHLDSEIMIMDEVLAVGDMAFQKKCIDKMREAAKKEGRTVLYVSHNMNTIRQLCDRCIVLDKGKIVYDGDVEEAIEVYLGRKLKEESYCAFTENDHEKWCKNSIRLLSREIVNDITNITAGKTLVLKVKYHANEHLDGIHIRLVLLNSNESIIGMAISENTIRVDKNEDGLITIPFHTDYLSAGQYKMRFSAFAINEYGMHDYFCVVNEFCAFSIQDQPEKHFGMTWSNNSWGNIVFPSFVIEDEVSESCHNHMGDL